MALAFYDFGVITRDGAGLKRAHSIKARDMAEAIRTATEERKALGSWSIQVIFAELMEDES